jgi:hypothetical protein
MELSVNLFDVRADAIGDQIMLVVVDLRIHNMESDAIYLVDWKWGRMILVRHARLICAVRNEHRAEKCPFSF